MFYRWYRLGPDIRLRVWRLYGWFAGLVACGSCFGAATWLTYMQCIANFYRSNALLDGDRAQWMALTALGYRLRAAFTLCYPIAIFCVSLAKLMVLDRLAEFAALAGPWITIKRVAVLVVVVGNVVGTASGFAAAAIFQQSARIFNAASASFAANTTVLDTIGLQYSSSGFERVEQAFKAESVGAFSEALVLLFIVISFGVAAPACARRIKYSLLLVASASVAASEGRTIRLQIVLTSYVVFVTFVVRAAFSTMFAAANSLQNSSASCRNDRGEKAGSCDASCYNVCVKRSHPYIFKRFASARPVCFCNVLHSSALIQGWMFYTPAFELTVELVSSPLALLVALWGMTTQRTWQLMNSKQPNLEISVPLR